MEIVKHYIRRDIQVYTSETTVAEDLISISFKNIGDKDAFINGFPLASGDPMLSFEGEAPNSDITKYDISFNQAMSGASRVICIKTRLASSGVITVENKCSTK